MEIPLGLRFQPFDYDVLRFLFSFVTGRSSVDDEALIHQEDIFGDKEPWELIPSGKNKAYFLTRLKKKSKSKKGSRVERTVGRKMMGKKSGNWHGQDTGKAVADEKGKFVMGYKRSFVYKNKREPEQDGKWLLKEFYLPETIMRRAKAEFRIVEEREDFVLCRLERKKKDGEDEEEDDDDENTLEQGSNDSEAVPVPVPVETTTLPQIAEGSDDDAIINSYLIDVSTETLLAPVDSTNNSYIFDVPVETTTLSQIAEGRDDDAAMNSYCVGVPIETAIAEGVPVPVDTLLAPAADNINSYMVGVPVDTIAEGVPVPVPVETLFALPAGDTDTADSDGDHRISSGVPVETLPEPSSSIDFNELIWNIEDVTTLIDFDF